MYHLVIVIVPSQGGAGDYPDGHDRLLCGLQDLHDHHPQDRHLTAHTRQVGSLWERRPRTAKRGWPFDPVMVMFGHGQGGINPFVMGAWGCKNINPQINLIGI